MEYDAFDRLQNLRFPNGTAGSGTASATDFESYVYDANGNRTSLTKRDRTTTIGFTYDTLNRVIVKDLPGGTANDVYSEYDAAGRPLWAKFVSDSGSGVVYGYDGAKRLTSETTFGRSVGFEYDLAGNRTQVTWPDGNFVYSSFDNLNRVNKVCENGSAGCASGLLATYTLDPLSRRTAIARPNGAASSFGYDLASRLTSLGHDVSGTPNDLTRTFTYNPAGQLQTRINATAAHAYSPPTANTGYAVNGRNQYTNVAGATHTHDLNGNLTGDGARSFGYDAENRLTSVAGTASLALTYDPLGRLRQTTAGAATTGFLYEGDRLIAEYNGATVLRRYAHGPGVDEPIVWYEGGDLTTKRWLHPDERGSIVAWTNASAGATVYKYGAYGEPAGADFSGSRFRYTGQIALPEVKLYHYKARVYDPSLGRFLQADPVGYQDDFNLYNYTANDPINLFDPRGEAVEVIRNGNRVTLNFYVKFVGSRTPANIRHMRDAARNVWSGSFGNYQVTANVLVPTKSTPPGLINVITIAQGLSHGGIRQDMKSGYIGASMSERGIGHEFGHLAYLTDPRHTNPKSVPSSDPDIMEKEAAPVLGTTIDRILKEASERGTLTNISSSGDEDSEQQSQRSEWSQFDGRIIGNACTSVRLGCR